MNPAQVEIVPLDPGLKESYLAAVRATSAEGSTYYKTTRYHKLNAKGFYSVKFPAFPAPVRMVVSGMDRPEGEFLQALGVYLRTQDPALLSKVEEIYVTQWYSLTSFNVKAEVSDDAKTLTVYLNGLGSLFKEERP